jgi:DNA-binding Xre family transcriptional regulator
MAISYNKLWKLLIDKKMNKKDLRLAAGVSTSVIAKLGKGENVTTDILLKICNVLDCDIADVMEIERGENPHEWENTTYCPISRVKAYFGASDYEIYAETLWTLI